MSSTAIKNVTVTPQNLIDANGGTITLNPFGSVTFPAGAFTKPTAVSFDQQKPVNFDQSFKENTLVYNTIKSLGYFLNLNIGREVINTNSFTVTLKLPSDFVATLNKTSSPEMFALLHQTDGVPIDSWELLPSVYDSARQELKATLPGYLVASFVNGDHTLQLTAAATPGEHMAAPPISPLALAPLATCQAASIGQPLAAMHVQEPFAELRKSGSGSYRLHLGADLTASSTDKIFAAGKGSATYYANINGYGKTIVVKHVSGVTTLYAHLNSFTVPDGKGGTKTISSGQTIAVNEGDQIATGVMQMPGCAGTGCTPHLHFEMAGSGIIFARKNKINPIDCTGNQVTGQIEFGDNGSLADDSFTLSLTPVKDGAADTGNTYTFGPSALGQRSFPVAINNLRIGDYVLALKVVQAPDDIGTYFVSLKSQAVFKNDGSTYREGSLPQGGIFSETIVVFGKNVN